jgi:hypothetical protein
MANGYGVTPPTPPKLEQAYKWQKNFQHAALKNVEGVSRDYFRYPRDVETFIIWGKHACCRKFALSSVVHMP